MFSDNSSLTAKAFQLVPHITERRQVDSILSVDKLIIPWWYKLYRYIINSATSQVIARRFLQFICGEVEHVFGWHVI